MIEIINNKAIDQEKAAEAKELLTRLGSKYSAMHTVMDYTIRMVEASFAAKLMKATLNKMRQIKETYYAASMKTTMYFEVRAKVINNYEIFYKGNKVETLEKFYECEKDFAKVVSSSCLSIENEWGWPGFERQFIDEMNTITKLLRESFL